METLSLLQWLLGGLSGVLVSCVLGVVGGGGSILPAPLMLYVVGVDEPHVAIGTSALAVAVNPALVAATGMPIIAAVGSSLVAVAVAALGMTTALNYAHAGLINWKLAAVFVVAGMAGGTAAAATSTKLASYRGALNTVFVVLIFITAAYMLWKVN